MDFLILGLLAIALILLLSDIFDPDIVNHFLAPSVSSSDLMGLENRIKQEKATKNYQPDKYAVLVRGSNEERFVAEVSLTYRSLLENGFKPENIYVLANVKKRKEIWFHPVDDIATKKNLEVLMDHLSNIIDEKDLLLICLVDHGIRKVIKDPAGSGKRILVSTFNLRGKDINEVEFGSCLSRIHPKRGILLFCFCYSGGFAHRLGVGQYVAIAETIPDRVGKSTAGNSFGGYFFEALSFRTGNKADTNKDNRISLQEALDYAKEYHSYTRDKEQQPIVKSLTPLTEIFIDE